MDAVWQLSQSPEMLQNGMLSQPLGEREGGDVWECLCVGFEAQRTNYRLP